MNHRAFFISAVLVTVSSVARGQSIVLPEEQRTNGAETLKALAEVQRRASASSVLIGSSPERSLTGVVISPDGYVLTQASDTEALKPLSAFLPGNVSCEVREVKRDDSLNLLLVKMDRTGLEAVSWGEGVPLRASQWLCSLTQQGRELRLGVVSAKRRPIPNSGAVLGIRFGVDDEEKGVIVEELAEDSPAKKAGVIANDVILYVNSVRVAKNEALAKIIASHRPGDVVKIGYVREGREAECDVRLASRRRVQMNWEGEDFGNHGTSLRTDNFDDVIQHDLPLDPQDMGGAVFDLEGRAVALNIARVDRVTNFALPAETFLSEVMRWIKEDSAKRSKT